MYSNGSACSFAVVQATVACSLYRQRGVSLPQYAPLNDTTRLRDPLCISDIPLELETLRLLGAVYYEEEEYEHAYATFTTYLERAQSVAVCFLTALRCAHGHSNPSCCREAESYAYRDPCSNAGGLAMSSSPYLIPALLAASLPCHLQPCVRLPFADM